MGERRLWVKLWSTWYTTPSHLGVGAMALHVGETLMTLVLWEPGRDDAWAEFETGAPLPIDAIASRAQVTARQANQSLAKLQERGTVSRRPDGAWGFLRYGPAQESADASRKRAARKVRGQSGICPPEVLRIVEGEGEVEAEVDLTTPTPPREGAKRGRKARAPSEHTEAAARILGHLNALRSAAVPGSNLTDAQHIETVLRARPNGEAEAIAVLDFMAVEARDTGVWAHFQTSTPFRMAHFEGRVARAQAASPAARGGRVYDRAPQTIDSELTTGEEARLWLTAANDRGVAAAHSAVMDLRASRRPS